MLSQAVGCLIKNLESLRSSLTKNILMCVGDLFRFLKRCMEPYLEKVMKALLKKAGDTNSFISEEADLAIEAICCNC